MELILSTARTGKVPGSAGLGLGLGEGGASGSEVEVMVGVRLGGEISDGTSAGLGCSEDGAGIGLAGRGGREALRAGFGSGLGGHFRAGLSSSPSPVGEIGSEEG